MNAPLEKRWRQLGSELGIPDHARSVVDGNMDRLMQHHRPTAEHCMRVGILAVNIGQHEGLPRRAIYYGGSMHDIGKLNVQPELLSKTEKWTPADAHTLERHPGDGYAMMVAEGMLVTAALVVRHHSLQPRSYPANIPAAPPYMSDTLQRCASVIAVADYYDASHRPNSAGLATEEAIRERLLADHASSAPMITGLYDAGILGVPI